MPSPLKRKAADQKQPSNSKKPRVKVPEYHLAASRRNSYGEIVWPAPKDQIEAAREFIVECAKSNKPTLLLPDKDADGLSAGVILYHTLTKLGLSESLISTYFPPKGVNVHDDVARSAITEEPADYIFVLDQGSRRSPALSRNPHKCLLIDHHFAEEGGFPEGAQYVTAYDCPPVATSSLLTYLICEPLHPDILAETSWLAALGTHGDLGNTLKWQPPFPDMTSTFQKHSKKDINDAVALINAPRRSAAYNVSSAWEMLVSAPGPESLLQSEALYKAKDEMSFEVTKWARTAPKFSADATIAVLFISSPAQIHPVIATRWAGHLQSGKLEVVMCANDAYLPGMVNFSCRVAKHARGRTGDQEVNIIKKLEGIVTEHPDLRKRLGESYARGHKEASGGIVKKEDWEELVKVMGVGQNVRKKAEDKDTKKPTQKNTLNNYFGVAKQNSTPSSTPPKSEEPT